MDIEELSATNRYQIEKWFNGDESGKTFLHWYSDTSKVEALLGSNRKLWLVKEDDQYVGFVDLEMIDKTGYFAYYIAPKYRGQRLSQKILLTLEEFGREFGLQGLVGYVEPENIASMKALERANYRKSKKSDPDGMLRFQKNIHPRLM